MPLKPNECVTIGLCRGRGFYSALLAWFGASRYTHGTTLWNGTEVLDAQESESSGMPSGVEIRPLSYLKNELAVDWYDVPCTVHQRALYRQCLDAQLHKPYDWIGIMDFITGAAMARNFRDQSAWFCFELIVWALEQSGISPPQLIVPYKIEGGDLACIISTLRAVPHES